MAALILVTDLLTLLGVKDVDRRTYLALGVAKGLPLLGDLFHN